QLILVGLKGTDVSAHKLTELFNKSVAVVESYAYGVEIKEAQRVNFVKGKSDQDNLNKLLKGQVDYILVDLLLIQYLVNSQEKEVAKYLAIGGEPLFTRSLHFAIRKDIPNADRIIRQFNTEIVKMIADGTYNRILQLNWIQADVDGDGQLELVLNGDHAGVKAPSNSYSVYFQNSNAGSSNWGRYYINGKLYNGWEEIPKEYKVAQVNKEEVTILKFSFN
ncbi:MAG TPA: transporter substrate-binding domain-containing protein, partial [Cyclobacteriaceae bacterium]|nr:transporter substrate-binding domain-containing protein [Cyclobacteriaceae bacterium]